MKLQRLFTSILLTLTVFMVKAQTIERITSSCQLSNRMGDTLTIVGRFDRCMEYSGFQTIKRDACSANFQMELNLKNIPENMKLTSNFRELSTYGCGGSFRLILRGRLGAEKENGYGHLGTNNIEFIVLEIIKIGKVRYSKPE